MPLTLPAIDPSQETSRMSHLLACTVSPPTCHSTHTRTAGPEGLQPDYLHKPASSSQQQQPEPVQLTAEAAHALEAVSRLGQLLNAQGPAQVCGCACNMSQCITLSP